MPEVGALLVHRVQEAGGLSADIGGEVSEFEGAPHLGVGTAVERVEVEAQGSAEENRVLGVEGEGEVVGRKRVRR